eukprot:TRINITY_DN7830_c0_g1_i1.p1 TRINITY_DN7830_c0_g1~~TRINITY_DN7830_c0_g1_i1.p1  ORF type:complete len:251 (+),score=65.24 TRINITY_DN7830_c0_g1_i1:112-864(+)
MSAARMRCMIQGCNAWEFDPQIHMCRNCIQSMAQVAAAARKYLKHPVLKPDMYVTQAIASPHYLGLQEGELCDVLDILEDNQSIIVKAKDGRIGYFNIDFIATEEEITTRFLTEEETAKIEAERRAKEEQKRAEEEYEERLRQRMKQRAAEDRERRAREEAQRKIEAEKLQREFEAMQIAEAERQRQYAEMMRRQQEEAARQAAAEQKAREEEARRMKAEWDAQQDAYAEQKRRQALPKWKRDMLARQGK